MILRIWWHGMQKVTGSTPVTSTKNASISGAFCIYLPLFVLRYAADHKLFEGRILFKFCAWDAHS